jgi:hypothetical protein
MNSNENAISNDDADGKFSCPRNGTPWDQNMGTMIASDRDYMKLTARLKYDYRDLDRGEAQLIRVGHALWRDRLKLGDTVAEREGINAALESVWKAKKEYRAELAKKRALRFSQYLDDYKPDSRFFRSPSRV